MKFSSDPTKAEINEKKHEVSFSDAETVFGDPLALTFYDTEHSDTEDRWLTFGISNTGKHLIVWHQELDSEIRVIGARRMDKTEKNNMNATNDEMKKHYDLNKLGEAETGKHYKAYSKTRGVQKSPTKVAISIRLDNDVVNAFKAKGKGWQTKVNEILRESVLGS